MSLRVLLVNRALPCHVRGGLEFHTLDLARGLARLGARVTLLSAEVTAEYREELRGVGIEHVRMAGVAVERYSLKYLRGVGVAIEGAAAREAFDVIHGQEFGLGFWRSAAGVGAQTVVTVHGTLTSETPLHPDVFATLGPAAKLRALGRFGRRRMFRGAWLGMLERAAAVVVDSEFSAGEVRRECPAVAGRLRRVALGVEMERYPPVDREAARRELGWRSEDEPHLVTVGRLEWQKGHELALEALAGFGERPWRYHVAGEGRERGRLERRAARLGIAGRVEFAGRVDDGVKARMLAGADLFVWPERTHPAFGLVGLEAMLMGTPVLASRRGAIAEVIDEGSGWLFEAGEPGGLAAALGGLLDEPDRLTAVRAGLRERTVGRFAPEAMARETLRVYEEVVAGA